MKPYILLLCIALLASCQAEEKEIPTVAFKEQLVLNSRVAPNNTLYVSVSKTLPPDQLRIDPGSLTWLKKVMVGGLQVYLEYDFKRMQLRHEGLGIYSVSLGSITPDELGHIRVYDRKNKLLLESYTTLQSEPNVTRWKPLAKVIGNDTLCSIKLRIEQDLHEQGHYLIGLSRWSEDLDLIQQRKMTLTRLLSDRDLFNQRAFLVQPGDFKNGVLELEKELHWLQADDTLSVSVSRLDADYYSYLKQQLKVGNWFNQLLGESSNIKGNVIGGLGYFTLHRSRTEFFIMKEHLR